MRNKVGLVMEEDDFLEAEESKGKKKKEWLEKIVLELEAPKLERPFLEKGFVTGVEKELVIVRLFYLDKKSQRIEKPGSFSRGEFYPDPAIKDLFVYEYEKRGGYLVERAINFGRVQSCKNDLLTQVPDRNLKKYSLFYLDKEGNEIGLNPLQFSSKLLLEGKPEEGEILVCRRGKMTIGEMSRPYAYLAVLSEKEKYLDDVCDLKPNVFEKWKYFCESEVKR